MDTHDAILLEVFKDTIFDMPIFTPVSRNIINTLNDKTHSLTRQTK